MKHKVIKAGNSLVVVIPSSFVKSVGVRRGDEVRVQTNIAKCKVTYSFSGFQQLALPEGLLQKSHKSS